MAKYGTPPTIEVQAPPPPAWLTAAGRWLWKRDYTFRCNAARAETEQYRRVLNRQAQQRYDAWYNG